MPPNITLIPLPAETSVSTGAENVWQFLRDNSLSNRIFKILHDVADHCWGEAWNNLVDQLLADHVHRSLRTVGPWVLINESLGV